MEEDIVKYRKKKESDTSKSCRKAKHKHIYSPCLLRVNNHSSIMHGHMYGASYCTICGKIGDSILGYDVIKLDNGHYRSLEDWELIEKYKDYPTYEIGNIFGSGYIAIGE